MGGVRGGTTAHDDGGASRATCGAPPPPPPPESGIFPPLASSEEVAAAVAAAGAAGRLVVLRAFAPHCRSCRTLGPKVGRLAGVLEAPPGTGVDWYDVDCTAHPRLCAELNVVLLPSFVVLRSGRGTLQRFSTGPFGVKVVQQRVMEELTRMAREAGGED